jgi:MFS family permease
MPLMEVIKTYPKEVLIAIGMRMAENISYYIFTIVVLAYATDFLGVGTDLILKMLLIGAAIQFFMVPALGALSDRVGRRPLYLVGAVGVGLWSFVFFGLIDSQSSGKVFLAVVVGLFFHSLMYAPQACSSPSCSGPPCATRGRRWATRWRRSLRVPWRRSSPPRSSRRTTATRPASASTSRSPR